VTEGHWMNQMRKGHSVTLRDLHLKGCGTIHLLRRGVTEDL